MDTHEKYESSKFVELFVARQYGPFLKVASSNREMDDNPVRYSCEPYYQKLIATARSVFRPGWTCIDVGCGSGRLVGELVRLGSKRTIGIDASARMIYAAASILRNPIDHELTITIPLSRTSPTAFRLPSWELGNVLLVQATAELLPLGSCTTDLVCCANVLTRLVEPRVALSELHRILRPGGYLMLSNDYDWSTRYTEAQYWFEDVRDELHPDRWSICLTEDSIPYTAWLHGRKAIAALNQIVLARRL